MDFFSPFYPKQLPRAKRDVEGVFVVILGDDDDDTNEITNEFGFGPTKKAEEEEETFRSRRK